MYISDVNNNNNTILGNVDLQIKNFLKDAKTDITYFLKDRQMLNSLYLHCGHNNPPNAALAST